MKTVLFTDCTHVWIGGVGARQSRLARLLPERRWRPIFALAWGARFHDAPAYRAAFPDLETVLLDGRTGSQDGRRLEIGKAIRKIEPDVILPGALADSWEVVRGLKEVGRAPRIAYGMVGVFPPSISFVRRFSPIIDRAFGVSRLTAEVLKSICDVPADRVDHIPTGIAPAAARARRLENGPIRIGYVGRFDPDKRPLDIAPLCAELEAAGVDFELFAVGSGVCQQELRAASSRWVESGRLRFPGNLHPAELERSVYPNLDVLVLFSPVEGLPNSLLEAMSFAVVPVVSDFHGRAVEDLVRDRETGLVFPVGDLRAAAARIRELWLDRRLQETLAEAALARVVERHDLKNMGDAFARMLDRALEGPARSSPIPPIPEAGKSRLRRIVGRAGAERLRKLFGIRFPHPDASEWPLIDNWVAPDRERVEAAIRSEILRLEKRGPATEFDWDRRAAS